MASVTWVENGILRSARLSAGVETLGREAPATIIISSPERTVSRQHVRLVRTGDGYRAENLSQTNLTLVNGHPAGNGQVLTDQDTLLLGTVVVTYHDLTKTSITSGLVCDNCRRDNPADRKDCWYCGQNLVNAQSLALRVRPAACRLLSPEARAFTLVLGSYLCLDATGQIAVRQGRPGAGACVAAIEVGADNSATISGTAAINGAGLVSSRVLRDGDVVTVAGRSNLVLLP